MISRISRLLFVYAFLAFATGAAFGWGEVGHRMVLKIAIDLMPPGERAPMLAARNFDALEYYTLLPDKLGEIDPARYRGSEGPNHYLNMEDLGPISDYDSFRQALGKETGASGRLVSRIHECSVKLHEAADRGQRSDWLHWAGFLCHYVGDAHQPLHTTRNHDGHETGNVFGLKDPEGGTVHIRFESGLLNHYTDEIEKRARDLAADYLGTHGGLGEEARRFREDPGAYITSFVWGAHGHVQEIVDADNRITGQRPHYNMHKGHYYEKLNKAVGELAAAQIARAAIATAAMWYECSPGKRLETSAATETGSGEFSTAFHKTGAIMPW